MKAKRYIALLMLLFCVVHFAMANGNREGSGPLLVYSPQSEEDLEYIRAAAAEALDFDVEILNLPGGELADRIIAEKQNPQADVVFGVVPLSMYQLKQEGILEPYTPPWVDGLPNAYQDKEHFFHSFWQTPVVIAYNSDLLTAGEAPKSWLDLAKDEYAMKYFAGQTAWQTTRTHISGVLWRFYDAGTGKVSEEGWNVLRKIYENSREWNPAWIEDFKSGVQPISIHWFGGIKGIAAEHGVNITFVNTTGGTPVIAEAIGLIKKDTDLTNAKAFIDWFGSTEFQVKLAHDLGKAPAHPEALALAPEETRNDMLQFTVQDVDWEIVAENLTDWLEKIELEIAF